MRNPLKPVETGVETPVENGVVYAISADDELLVRIEQVEAAMNVTRMVAILSLIATGALLYLLMEGGG